MTTAKPKTRADAKVWPPYPELPRVPQDMRQNLHIDDLHYKLRSILTPGDPYPYHPTILIGREIPIYYGEPRPGASGPPPHVIPDFLIAFDVDTQAIWERIGYDPIQNGKPPDVVVEVASPSTRRNDSDRKRSVYEMIRVPEYWRFDPTGGRLYGQSIIGERLVNDRYERFPLHQYDDGSEGSTSSLLNVNFRWRPERFYVHDPITGLEYEHPRETSTRLQSAKERLQAEIARLQEENRRLRGEG